MSGLPPPPWCTPSATPAQAVSQSHHRIHAAHHQPKACTESCAIPVPCDSADKAACASVVKLFTADQWSVTLVTLPPGAKYPQHTHLANFLNVPLADADITMKNQDQPETVVHNKTGEVTWNNPVVHTVTNTGKTAAKVVVLEFRGRPAGEGSESMGPERSAKTARPQLAEVWISKGSARQRRGPGSTTAPGFGVVACGALCHRLHVASCICKESA